MAEMVAMASDAARLKAFLNGDCCSNKYARLSFSILVRWTEEEKSNAPAALIERAYKDLSIAVDQPRHTHPIHEALGVLGFALREMKIVKPKMFESERHTNVSSSRSDRLTADD